MAKCAPFSPIELYSMDDKNPVRKVSRKILVYQFIRNRILFFLLVEEWVPFEAIKSRPRRRDDPGSRIDSIPALQLHRVSDVTTRVIT